MTDEEMRQRIRDTASGGVLVCPPWTGKKEPITAEIRAALEAKYGERFALAVVR